jgi:hypothetical protein
MHPNRPSSSGRMNRWFTAAAVFAGVLAGAHFADALRPQTAQAQQSEPLSPFNSGEQRRQMIEQLREMNTRLGRLESQLKTGISVKVTEMPPQKESKP